MIEIVLQSIICAQNTVMASRRAAADSEGGEEGIEVMTDADFEQAMEALRDEGSEDVGELLSK